MLSEDRIAMSQRERDVLKVMGPVLAPEFMRAGRFVYHLIRFV